MRIRVLREAGGIGDVVRCTVAIRGLREKYPEAEIWGYVGAPFVSLYERAECLDRIIPVPLERRRPRQAPPDAGKWPYLAAPEGVSFDLTVDLYCPAFAHELASGREQWLDRIDLFCRAAGVNPADKCPRLTLHPEDETQAAEALQSAGLSPAPRRANQQSAIRNQQSRLIALQPFSTDPARDWPEAKWRALAGALVRRGHRVVVLDCCAGRTRGFPAPRICDRPLPVVAAILKRCDLLIGPDSGLFHLAAAVGTPAIGLFASQSGALMRRYYPRHTYINPPADAACPGGARWPCFWQRPPECSRDALKRANRTCAALARIEVETVLEAAEAAVAGCRLPVAGEQEDDGLRTDVNREPATGNRIIVIAQADGSCDRIRLEGPLTADLFAEAFRVLKVGGVLELAQAAGPAALPGMERVGAAEGARLWRKVSTWPKPQDGWDL